ncbi:O-antigen polymerase [Arthrobacter sp. 135MFCol5.1]|uniref:O-antigen polymerase n=1 Tax=Arthrobacter sp. 135MFCol5.1 TaxID=1158050 RepID=UPI0012DF2059|nr:O-antigen polymerase [Arthrobacter sp. 135MFCol5.1]
MEYAPLLILMLGAACTWPLLAGILRAREVLVIVVPVMAVYGSLSIFFGRSDSAPVQWWLLLLAVVSIMLGRVFVRGALAYPPNFSVVIRDRFLIWSSLVGLLSASYLLATHGVPVLSSNVAVLRVEILSNGYISTIMVASLQAAIVLALVGLNADSSFRRNFGLVALALGLIGVILLFGNRGTAVFPLLGVGVFYLLKNYTKTVPIAISAVLLLAVVSIAGYVRNFTTWGSSYDNDLARMGYEGPIKYFAPVIDYMTGTSTAMGLILDNIPSKVDFPLGSVFFSPILAPLPGEQPSPGVFLKHVVGFNFEGFGLAMGGIGGFYMDFGAFGVLVGFLLIGLFAGFVRKRSQADARWTVVLAWLGGHLILMNYAHPLPNFATIALPFILFAGLRPPQTASEGLIKAKAAVGKSA